MRPPFTPFTDDERSIMAEFQSHLTRCVPCQKGPATICDEGRQLADRFDAARQEEVERRWRQEDERKCCPSGDDPSIIFDPSKIRPFGE